VHCRPPPLRTHMQYPCRAVSHHCVSCHFVSLCVKLLSFAVAQQLGKGCYVRVLWVFPTDRQMSLSPFFPGRDHPRQSSLASFRIRWCYTPVSFGIQLLRRRLSTTKKPNRKVSNLKTFRIVSFSITHNYFYLGLTASTDPGKKTTLNSEVIL
jgi:hypothetical protein